MNFINRLSFVCKAGGVSAVSLLAGCGMFGGGSSVTYNPQPLPTEPSPVVAPPTEGTANGQIAALARDPNALFDNNEHHEPAAGQIVNIFGEFGDKPAPPPKFGPGGYEQATFLDEGYDADVEVSPDGEWLVFSSTRHNEHPEIYLQRVGGLSVTQLTSDGADDSFPTFSPDARKVAFSSTRNGSWDIYMMDIDGKNITQLTSSTMQELHPSFSPDGTRIVYCATGTRSGQWELWTIDLRSMEKRMIGYGLFPTWSPNKQKDVIAFQRPRQRGSRWFSVWTADIVNNEARAVTEVAVSGNAAVVSPSWNPDGSMLAFSTIVNPGLGQGNRSGTQQDVWVIRADGTNRRRVTDGNGINATPSWSRDGRVFFVSDRGGADAIWSSRVDQPQTMTAGGKLGDPFANTDKEPAQRD